MNNHKKVNLFVVGAAKCGTTSLYHYLDKHPDVFMCPVKEPHFFSEIESKDTFMYVPPKKGWKYSVKIIKDYNIYNGLFEGVKSQKIVGEASTSYLWDTTSARKIYDYNNKAKIVIMVRNPKDRLVSHYLMERGAFRESLGLIDAVKKDMVDCEMSKNRYFECGLYSKQIKGYVDLFGTDNVFIVDFRDFKNNIYYVLKSLSEFLDIDNRGFELKILEDLQNTTLEPKLSLFKLIGNIVFRYKFIGNSMIFYLPNKVKKIIKRIFFRKSKFKLNISESKFLDDLYDEEIRKMKSNYNIDFNLI